MVLIPVKSFENAKQRLSPLLTRAQRAQLAETMLQDVLRALAATVLPSPVAVVTGDAAASVLAHSFGFETITDPHEHGETEAIAMAAEVCVRRGFKSTLVLPADIPLMSAAEVKAIFAAAARFSAAEGCVLVPAADRRGTNAVLRRPGNLFPLRFGNDSFQPHLQAARASARQLEVLELRGIGLDIDRPADLSAAMTAPGSTRTQALLRDWSHRFEPELLCQQ